MTRANELVRLLTISSDFVDGNANRNHINGRVHALRVATLARRHDPDDIDAIFSALVHDLARPLSDPFHGEVIAEIVRDLVSHNWYRALQKHGDYQSDYIHGTYTVNESLPWHEHGKKLCAWEIRSFAKDWSIVTMTYSEAIELIQQVCGDRT